MMRVEHFPNWLSTAGQTSPLDRLVSMLNDRAEEPSPLEAAQQALLDAKTRLEQQRDERIEGALDGYRALRSRQTSYENELSVQQEWRESFHALNSRYNALPGELSSARAEYEAYADPEAMLDTTQHRLSLRVSSLENELAVVDEDIAALVERANRYGSAQRQYAAYLSRTGQDGYAAFQYLDQAEYTTENFARETANMVDRMEAGAGQWRDRVSSYCEQFGLTPYDFEAYLQERRKLSDACLAAQQRLSELLYAAGGALNQQGKPTQSPDTPARSKPDTVEISTSARRYIQRVHPPMTAVEKAEPDDASESAPAVR